MWLNEKLLGFNSYFALYKSNIIEIMEETAVKKNNHGSNVRRWREWRNINQDVLAEKIGVSQATLSSYEKKDKLEADTVEKIAKALNIPVEAITEVGNDSSINIISLHDSSSLHDNSGSIIHNPTFNPLDKVIELYERLLKSEQEKVSLLQEIINDKK